MKTTIQYILLLAHALPYFSLHLRDQATFCKAVPNMSQPSGPPRSTTPEVEPTVSRVWYSRTGATLNYGPPPDQLHLTTPDKHNPALLFVERCDNGESSTTPPGDPPLRILSRYPQNFSLVPGRSTVPEGKPRLLGYTAFDSYSNRDNTPGAFNPDPFLDRDDCNDWNDITPTATPRHTRVKGSVVPLPRREVLWKLRDEIGRAHV